MAAFYPNIRDDTILMMKSIELALDKDPSYLDKAECTYSDTVKNFFRARAAPKLTAPIFTEEGATDEELDVQIKRLMSDLESFGQNLTSADHSEKLQYFKTKTVLIEKLVNIQEKILNLRELNEFRSVLLQFMEEICTKDQITTLMTRLDGIFGTGNKE